MRFDLHHPSASPEDRPLLGEVEALDAAHSSRDGGERDEAIIQLLREKLRGRQAPRPQVQAKASPADPAAEDKYEPQRLNRKICWQYDSTARKIPLLRRHYI